MQGLIFKRRSEINGSFMGKGTVEEEGKREVKREDER